MCIIDYGNYKADPTTSACKDIPQTIYVPYYVSDNGPTISLPTLYKENANTTALIMHKRSSKVLTYRLVLVEEPQPKTKKIKKIKKERKIKKTRRVRMAKMSNR